MAFTETTGELRGCNVYVGGGMGRTHNKEETLLIADPLGYVPADRVLDLVQSVLASSGTMATASWRLPHEVSAS